MSPIHCFQYFVYSVCIHGFTVFIYITFYSDLLISNEDIRPSYDFIIVGAGTAGSLIAYRIASETNFTYIVIEAGVRSNALLDIPVLGPLLHGSVHDWQYATVPQENGCFAMDDKICKLIQGKIVGGSSKLNNMIHTRGNISQYVDWFHGKHSRKSIEQHFDYIENNIIQLDEIKYQSIFANAILESAKELGYKNIDLNKKFNKGFMKIKVSQRHGKRWTTSDKIADSQHLVTNAVVEKVHFNQRKIAYAVTFQKSGIKCIVKAKKGVILSAGAINTPKILQLSGVGPSHVLNPLNISITEELDVGMNLQDHITTGLDLIAFDSSVNISPTDMLNPLHILDYFIKGKGPFTSPGCEAVGFLSTNNCSVPDIQFMVLPVGLTSDRGVSLRKTVGIADDVWQKYFVPSFGLHTATILPILLHPKSRGEVRISSKDPTAPLMIDPRYLTNKEDIETIVKGLKLVKEFVESNAMKSIGAYLNPKAFPGCESYFLFNDEYWQCYVKHLTLSVYHYVGTCKMGLPDSKKSVVNTNFEVIGLKRLFIADGSVLPALPSGNINAAIAMMANVFFETVIMPEKVKVLSCQRYEYLYQYLFKICPISKLDY